MGRDIFTTIIVGGLVLSLADGGDRTLLIGIDEGDLEAQGGADALFEALSGRDDLCERFDRFRIDPGDLASLALSGRPDPVVLLLAGTGGPTLATGSGHGALSGVLVAASPGHGWYYNESRELWTTQRGEHNGILEDEHNARFVSLWLAPLLEAAGARVVDPRRHVSSSWERIAGPTDPGLATTTGGWRAFDGPGSDHAIECEPLIEPCEASFTLSVQESAVHPVMVLHPECDHCCTRVTWTLSQASSSFDVSIDPSDGQGSWMSLGRFALDAADPVVLTVRAEPGWPGSVAVAGVRVGGGMGDTVREGTTSGVARWQEGSLYWLASAGVPGWVTDCADTDIAADRRTRARAAAWMGADAFMALHTNGGGGTGTVTFIHDSSPPPGSEELALGVQRSVVEAIRASWDPEWTDRGLKRANMDELADARPMPSLLMEVGFHDNEHDAALLREPLFRRTVARAIVRGLVEELDPLAPPIPPAPRILEVVNEGSGRLLMSFEPGFDPLAPYAGDWTYELHASTGRRAVARVREIDSCCSAVIEGFAEGEVVLMRMAARSTSGASLLSGAAVVIVGEAPAPVLVVDGFDLLSADVDETVNTGDTSLENVLAIRQAVTGPTAADWASGRGAAALAARGGYTLVSWHTGLQGRSGSCVDSSLAGALVEHLRSGGALLASGERIVACAARSEEASVLSLLDMLGAAPSGGTPCEGGIVVPAAALEIPVPGSPDVPYEPAAPVPVLPRPGAIPWATCPTGASVAVISTPTGERGAALTLDVPLEAVGTASDRARLLAAALDALAVDLASPVSSLPGPGDPPAARPPDPVTDAPAGCSAGAVH